MERSSSSSSSFGNRSPQNFPDTKNTFTSQWYSQPAFFYALIVIVLVVVLAALSKWSEGTSFSRPLMKKIKSMIAQAVRFNSLAQQDTSPLMQLIHCNYALANAQMTRSLFSDQEIEQVTGIEIHELINYLDECQAFAVKNISNQCPKIQTDGVYSTASGWN
jgi:hypothetical protein